MRNDLPKRIHKKECGIVNLDDRSNPGTHWTCYAKIDNNIKYFDSYGNIRPPLELVSYFNTEGSDNRIIYNHDRVQRENSYNCGHLCLNFLNEVM